MESDEALVARFNDGDRSAFRVLVERYQRPIHRAAHRILGNAADASDVTQAVFTEVAERLHGFDPRHRFFSWIYRIAVNAALNVVRRRRREAALGVEVAPAAPVDPEAQLDGQERARRLQEALMSLGEEHRVVVTLRHFSDLSYREIALVLELEERTVKSRLFEARQRLRSLLSEEDRP